MKTENIRITSEYIDNKKSQCKRYPIPKYLLFCEKLLKENKFIITLYEARKTHSKYVTISNGKKSFKVRFSNHQPIAYRELKKHCDFFVGVTNFNTTTTLDALNAVREFFNIKQNDLLEHI